ncbi:serine threonine kinase 10 [Cichlidogyrus casuarinus]|uniref:Serine threonine kinase 10 n=1 Tax=Cichlidogyrus casuarinus TaxID=1844966 RepID=A0ABD2Q0Z8_9PLAT
MHRARAEETNSKRQLPDNLKKDVNPDNVWENNLATLGVGAFGTIFKAKRREHNVLAALKRIDYESDDELEDLLIELEILNLCQHPNILGIIDSFIYDSKIWLYLEFCAHGALDSIMNTLERPLEEAEIRFVCKEMTKALEFIHSNLIIHRDLKAGNILITEKYEVKLSDFGVSARMKTSKSKRDSFVGTPYWMSPEVVACESTKEEPYDTQADIWSYGVTLIELAEMRPPHQDMNPNRVLMRIRKSEPPTLSKPSKWSSNFVDFLNACLQRNPADRKPAQQLLHHDFISNVTESDRKFIKILIAQLSADIEEVIEEIAPSDLDDPFSDLIVSPQVALAMKHQMNNFDASPTLLRRRVSPSPTQELKQICTTIDTGRFGPLNEMHDSAKPVQSPSQTIKFGKGIVKRLKRSLTRHFSSHESGRLMLQRARSTENLAPVLPRRAPLQQQQQLLFARATHQGLTFAYRSDMDQRQRNLAVLATPMQYRRNRVVDQNQIKNAAMKSVVDCLLDEVILSDTRHPSIMGCVLDVMKSLPIECSDSNSNVTVSLQNQLFKNSEAVQ